MDAQLILIVSGLLYLLSSIIVAAVANERGWDGFTPFIVSIIATPLVAAILYSPYKREEHPPVDKDLKG